MSARRAVILGGRTGLLGMSLTRAAEEAGWEALPMGRADVDPTDTAALRAHLESAQPDVVFNTVAYTAVDKAEDEPKAAFLLNKALPCNLGKLSRDLGFRLVQYSTDFVFDGRKKTPYEPDDPTGPACVYGESKLAGEQALLDIAPDGLLIVRTSWLFGPGKGNFVRTILTLAEERQELGVVHDQVGSPTYTPDLAASSLALADTGAQGIFHLANCGQASWCELAAEAVNLVGLNCAVNPITSADYPQKAQRPAFSVLSNEKFKAATGITPRPWAQALRDYVFLEFSPE